MKRVTAIIVCASALLVVLFPAICRSGVVFLASAGGNLTLPGAGEQLIVPDGGNSSGAKTAAHQGQDSAESSSNTIDLHGDFSAMDEDDFIADKDDSSGGFQAEQKTPDSSVKHYLLIAIVGGAAGLVLVAAGLAQWWRLHSLRQNWLFPMVQDEGEPEGLVGPLPTPLIAKKQHESPQDEETEKPARRRAA